MKKNSLEKKEPAPEEFLSLSDKGDGDGNDRDEEPDGHPIPSPPSIQLTWKVNVSGSPRITFVPWPAVQGSRAASDMAATAFSFFS